MGEKTSPVQVRLSRAETAVIPADERIVLGKQQTERQATKVSTVSTPPRGQRYPVKGNRYPHQSCRSAAVTGLAVAAFHHDTGNTAGETNS